MTAHPIVCLFPLAPVLDLLDTDAPIRVLAERIRVHPRTVLKWQEQGGVDVWTADRIATCLGQNAERLWPGYEATLDHVVDATPEQLDIFDAVSA